MMKTIVIVRLFLMVFVVYGCLTSKIYALNDLQPIPYGIYDNSTELVVQPVSEIVDTVINSRTYKCGLFLVLNVVNSRRNSTKAEVLISDTIFICVDYPLQPKKNYGSQCYFSFPSIEIGATYHVYLTSKDSIFFLNWYEKSKCIKKGGSYVELLQSKELRPIHSFIQGYCYGIVYGEVLEDLGITNYGDSVRKVRIKVLCVDYSALCYLKDTLDILLIPECEEYDGKYLHIPIVKGSKYYFQVSLAKSVENCQVDYLGTYPKDKGIYVCLWYFWES